MVKLPKKFSIGERVFAKVRGYPPWPAKIENITDPNTKTAKYHVIFFGTKEIGTCKIEDLFQYAENKDKFSKTVRRKFFHEGLQELEEDLKKNPNPVSANSSKESAENVPENIAEDVSEKTSEAAVPSSGGDEDTDTGNLVIDEGDKKKALKRKSTVVPITPDVSEAKKKRGRKSMSTILAENTPKQDHHDSQDEDSEKVSRSGRKIKPKRFHDSIDAEISIDTSRNDQSVRSRTKSKTEDSNENQESPIAPIKKRMSVDSKISTEDANDSYNGRLLLARTIDGQDVGIKLDVDRPEKFDNEKARARWDLSVARNAMRLKEQIEGGDVDPDYVKDSLDFNVCVPEDDSRKSYPADDAETIKNNLKLKVYRTEAQIMFLDTQIRSSLGLDSANTEECLDAMDQVAELQMTPLMLKKHSHLVETVKRLRRYVGNLPDWKYSEEETIIFKQKADQIKKKAEQLYDKFRSIFEIPEGESFWNTFRKQIEVFKEYTKDLTQEELYALLEDPTEHVKSTATPDEKNTSITNTSKSADESIESVENKNDEAVESETK